MPSILQPVGNDFWIAEGPLVNFYWFRDSAARLPPHYLRCPVERVLRSAGSDATVQDLHRYLSAKGLGTGIPCSCIPLVISPSETFLPRSCPDLRRILVRQLDNLLIGLHCLLPVYAPKAAIYAAFLLPRAAFSAPHWECGTCYHGAS